MKAVDKYLSKFPEKLLDNKPSENLAIVVTIPAYNEAETIKSLEALLACDRPNCSVEVLVNVNYSEKASESSKHFNNVAFELLSHFAKANTTENFQIHIFKFPNQELKTAGVGLARKQTMDEAFRRLLSVDNPSGIITGFDADSDCRKDYFTSIESFFEKNQQAKACSIQFAHPLSGSKYGAEIYDAIAMYELHLRYFINAQLIIGTPYAFQTVGSSLAVRADAYAQVNGMAPKKAGEDFYLLQKLMGLGGFYQLNTTCIYPSSRISNRVGFGTGPSVGEISESGEKLTYNFKSFIEIKKLYDALPALYTDEINVDNLGLESTFYDYLLSQKVNDKIANLRKHNKTYEKFWQAFMQWFNGFQILKVLNVLRLTEGFENTSLKKAIEASGMIEASDSVKEMLIALRAKDGEQAFYTLNLLN
jgi:cellulose synthase/poly-beta-1,6-N-acetylglucosamine synthase-like glycosyltransferase